MVRKLIPRNPKVLYYLFSTSVLFAYDWHGGAIRFYLLYNLLLCLLVYSNWPYRFIIPDLKSSEKIIILINILITILLVNGMISYHLSSIDDVLKQSDFIIIIICVISNEIIFTIGHMLLHTRVLYTIHKTHHKFKISSALTAFYSHPLDHLFILFAFIITPFIILHYYKISSIAIAMLF